MDSACRNFGSQRTHPVPLRTPGLAVADIVSRYHHRAAQEVVGAGRNSWEHYIVQDTMSAVKVDVAAVVAERIVGARR